MELLTYFHSNDKNFLVTTDTNFRLTVNVLESRAIKPSGQWLGNPVRYVQLGNNYLTLSAIITDQDPPQNAQVAWLTTKRLVLLLWRWQPMLAQINSLFIQFAMHLLNNQSAKLGLNISSLDAGFGQFFTTLDYIASIAGAVVVKVNPAYTSQLLAYRDELVFTDRDIRSYFDLQELLYVDRDMNASINIKWVGRGLFRTIKCQKGKVVITAALASTSFAQRLPLGEGSSDSPFQGVRSLHCLQQCG